MKWCSQLLVEGTVTVQYENRRKLLIAKVITEQGKNNGPQAPCMLSNEQSLLKLN